MLIPAEPQSRQGRVIHAVELCPVRPLTGVPNQCDNRKVSGHVLLASGMEEGVPVLRLEWEGDPMPEEYRRDIFDPATQARLWKDLGHRSVGIGPAFCKVAVQRMGGRIWVDASEGRNSVRLSLPVISG